MREKRTNLWDIECDVRCITTNGQLSANGAIMGGGCALEARQRHPDLPERYAQMITTYGHHVFLMPYHLVMFPVKNRVKDKASIDLIAQSAEELWHLVNTYEWSNVAVPRPGCGLGGLDWTRDVRPVLAEVWDRRFIVVDFPPARSTP